MIFQDITIIDDQFKVKEHAYVGVLEDRIAYIGDKMPEEDFGEVYDGKGKLLMSGFFDTHGHCPMTLLRGYGENMSLNDWLFKKIFPFEDQLNEEAVYNSVLMSMAEAMKFGIVSISDMYYFMDQVCDAFLDSGMKGNVSRSVSFFEDGDFMENFRAAEMIHCYEKYHGAGDGRIKVDMSLHSEYTTTEPCCKAVADYAKKVGTGMQVHVSETENEVKECIERHGMTPVKYLAETGAFDVPTIAAHCVWLTDEDFDILKEKNVTVAVNPISNLKLASGVCNVPKLFEKGINVTIGTDGVASNNSLNFLEEMKVFALLSKMQFKDPEAITPEQTLRAATVNGALAQGRTDCGLVKEGYKADLIVMDIDQPNMRPVHDLLTNILYSACSGDIKMTMVDGKILYENGEYKTIDIATVMDNVDRCTQEILDKLKQN